MELEEQLMICYHNYKIWKEKALNSFGLESKKAMEKAFFWLEIHSALFAVGLIELKAKTKEEKKKVIEAKKKICDKLSEYEKILLEEIQRNYLE